MKKPVITTGAVLIACVLLATGCSGSSGSPKTGGTPTTTSPPKPAALWPAPPNALKLTVDAGLKPEVRETLQYHVHAHLDVFIDGKPVLVPSGIGINIDDPGVKKFTDDPSGAGYGGIELCDQPCISPLHTHDSTGIVHTESATSEPNTLGQFFTEWGVRLTATCVKDTCEPTPIAFYVNGTHYTDDPAAIPLIDHAEIAVVIGDPPAEIPSTGDFSNA
jgi:hypothetical protein